MNKNTAVVLLLATLFGTTSSENCDLAELDRSAFTFIAADLNEDDIVQPSDYEALCRGIHLAANQTGEFFHRCLPKEVEMSMNIVRKSIENVVFFYCDQPGAVTERVKPINKECARIYTQSTSGCLPKFVSDLEAASTASVENVMALACCFFYDFEDCYFNAFNAATSECRTYIQTADHWYGATLLTDGCVATRETCQNLEPVDRSKPPTFVTHFPPLVNILRKVYKE